MDEQTIKKCNNCAPKGVKYSLQNGRPQVMVGEDFLKEEFGGQSWMDQAKTLAEMIAKGDVGQEYMEDGKGTGPLPPEWSRKPEQGADPFSAAEGHLLAGRESPSPAESRTLHPSTRNYTTAEVFGAQILGSGPPKEGVTKNFTLQETEAKDVLPGGHLIQEANDETGEQPKKKIHPYPDLIGPDGKSFPDYDNPKPVPTDGGTATTKDEDGQPLPDRGEGAATAKAKAEGKEAQDANPYGERRCSKPEEREAAEAKAPTLEQCPESIYLRRSWSQEFFHYLDCAEKATDIKWDEDKQFSEKLLTEEQKESLEKARKEASKACDEEIADAGGNFAILEKLAEDLIGVGLQDKYEINEFWENIAAPASRVNCTAPCKRKRVEPIWWTINYEVISKDIVKESFNVVKDVDFSGTYVVVVWKIRSKMKAKINCIFKVTCEK